MRIRYFAAVAVSLLVAVAARSGDTFTAEQMARLKRGVVSVLVEYGEEKDNRIGYGTGFVVGDGLILTNAHVVNMKALSGIYVYNESLPRTEAQIVDMDYAHLASTAHIPDIVKYLANRFFADSHLSKMDIRFKDALYVNDLALLRFDAPGGIPPPILTVAPDCRVMEGVTVLGYPHQVNSQASRNITDMFLNTFPTRNTPLVFACGRVNAVLDVHPRKFVHDAIVASGNSGGPVVNDKGEVVGVQTWTIYASSLAENSMSMAIGPEAIARFLKRNGIPAASGESDGKGEFAASAGNGEGGGDVAELLRLAEAGDNESQVLAGFFHYLGEGGVEKNTRRAVEWLERSLVDDGDGSFNGGNLGLARGVLAAVYLFEPEFLNPRRAKELLRAANDSSALIYDRMATADARLLGLEAELYYQGEMYGVEYNPERSFVLAEAANRDNNLFAEALLGFHYFFGDSGIGSDEGLALHCAFDAANAGIAPGLSLLALIYLNDNEVPLNERTAQIAFDLAMEAEEMGDPWADGILAVMHYDGTPAVAKNTEMARHHALKALRYGNRLGMYIYGKLLLEEAEIDADAGLDTRAWAFLDLGESRGVRSSPSLADEILKKHDRRRRIEIIVEGRKLQKEYLAGLSDGVALVDALP